MKLCDNRPGQEPGEGLILGFSEDEAGGEKAGPVAELRGSGGQAQRRGALLKTQKCEGRTRRGSGPG